MAPSASLTAAVSLIAPPTEDGSGASETDATVGGRFVRRLPKSTELRVWPADTVTACATPAGAGGTVRPGGAYASAADMSTTYPMSASEPTVTRLIGLAPSSTKPVISSLPNA